MRKKCSAFGAVATFSALAALGSACSSFSASSPGDDAGPDAASEARPPSDHVDGGGEGGEEGGDAALPVGPVSDPYATAVLADSPLAYWRLDEKTGTDAGDRTGNGYTGLYFGNVALGQTGALGSTSTDTCIGLQGTDT